MAISTAAILEPNGSGKSTIFNNISGESAMAISMADLSYTTAVHARVARELRTLADEMCERRLMAFGGGGYNPGNVAAAWTNTLMELS